MIKRNFYLFLVLLLLIFYNQLTSSDKEAEKRPTKRVDEYLWREITENYPDTQAFFDLDRQQFNGPLEHLNFLETRKIHEISEIIYIPEDCDVKNDSLIFLIGIKSLPASRARRDIIRKTWGDEQYWDKIGRQIPKNIKLKRVFLLGKSLNKTLQNEIKDESREFGDILQSSFQEHLYTLTYNNGS